MKKTLCIWIALIIAILSLLGLGGCAGRKRAELIEREIIVGPSGKVEEYLRYVYSTRRRDEAHDLLTPEARRAIPLKDFRALLRDELKDVFSSRRSSDMQIRVDPLKDFMISDDHHIVYSLLQVLFPYEDGSNDTFGLVRFHVYRIGTAWYLEPFIDEKTFTKRLVPLLVTGSLSRLENMRPEFYDIYGSDLLEERKKIAALEEASKGADEGTPKVSEVIGELVVPDMRTSEGDGNAVEEDSGGAAKLSDADRIRKVNALMEVGELHFQTGNIDAADKSFRKVLEIDPSNQEAKTQLEKLGVTP